FESVADGTSTAVVVPLYRPPDEVEVFSFQHNTTILAGYPTFLLCPDSFDATQYQEIIGPAHELVRVPDVQMSSWHAYSALLCSEEFYLPFTPYANLLVLHLNALILDEPALRSW